jgi:PAS domain S-box-containing protein
MGEQMAKKQKSNASKAEHKILSEFERAEADALFSSIGEGAILTDEEGKISRINKTALQILGLKKDEALGKWFPEVIIAEDEAGNRIPNIDRPITTVFLTGEPYFSKLNYVKKDGTRVAVALTVSPVLINSKPVGAIQVFRDITEEARLEHARDEFIALASHQLRTPATGVKQYAGMLLEGYAGNLTPQQEDMLKKIYESNERQITIVNDLLRVAQVDAGQVKLKKEPTEIVSFLGQVIDEQTNILIPKSQKIIFSHNSEKIMVDIDNNHMRMALENIIDNASKYSPMGKDIKVAVSQNDESATIEIADEGVGIKDNDLDQIFQKFRRLKNKYSTKAGGSGLGLYWAKRIIDLHNAELNVSSAFKEGTVFTIRLPKNPTKA